MSPHSKFWQPAVIAILFFCVGTEPTRDSRTARVAAAVSIGASRENRLPSAGEPLKAWITTREGDQLVGTLVSESFDISVGTEIRPIAMRDLLSFHSAEPASAKEAERISSDIETLAGNDIKSCETASAELTDIGLPVLSALLKSYQDTDAHEPDYRYRLFGRIVPGHADAADRTLDLVRLVSGEVFRGKLATAELKFNSANGNAIMVPTSTIRRLAIQQTNIAKSVELQALHHCTYVGFVDTGIAVDESSTLRANCAGFVRLSFDEDGWACDPDGIKEPLAGKRKLQEGFRWGAVLGRVGPKGERWLVGKSIEKKDLGSGRLYIVINDNEHWQNNIGSFRAQINVTNAYDLGDPQ